MRIKHFQSLLLLLACLSLVGCWESTDVTFHTPGEYFGPLDDLNTNIAALQERMTGQHDR